MDFFYYFNYVIAIMLSRLCYRDYVIATHLSVVFRVHPCTKLKLSGGKLYFRGYLSFELDQVIDPGVRFRNNRLR